jgi:hypothetical protein
VLLGEPDCTEVAVRGLVKRRRFEIGVRVKAPAGRSVVMNMLHVVETVVAGPHEDTRKCGAAVAVTDHFVAVLHAGESPASSRAVHAAAGLFLRGAVSDDPSDAAHQLAYAVRRTGETLNAVVYDRRHHRVWQLGACQWRCGGTVHPPATARSLHVVELDGTENDIVLATAAYPDIAIYLNDAEQGLDVDASRAWVRLSAVATSATEIPQAA